MTPTGTAIVVAVSCICITVLALTGLIPEGVVVAFLWLATGDHTIPPLIQGLISKRNK